MTALIQCLYEEITFESGDILTAFGGGDRPAGCFWPTLAELPQQWRVKGRVLQWRWFAVLADGERVPLAVAARPCLLPDRSGVLVIHPEAPAATPDPGWLAPPHNAAIHDADGGLRFRLVNPLGEGSYLHSPFSRTLTHAAGPYGQVLGELPAPVHEFGVLAGACGHPPEWFLRFDGHSPGLQRTGLWVRY